MRIEYFEITAIYQEGITSGRGGVRLANTEHVQIVSNFLHDLNPNPDGYDIDSLLDGSHDRFLRVR